MMPKDSPDLPSQKRAAAQAAAQLVRDGMCVGLGTGSTASLVVEMLAEAVRAGLRVRCVATSPRTQQLAERLGLPLVALNDLFAGGTCSPTPLDITIDGADEIDPGLNLVKGAGGALLREKIVAQASRELVIVADSSKVVRQLGAAALPVEVVPFGCAAVAVQLQKVCGPGTMRRDANQRPWVTPDGNYIIDFQTGPIADPVALARQMNAVAGVVEHGLFCGMARRVLVGRSDRVEILLSNQPT